MLCGVGKTWGIWSSWPDSGLYLGVSHTGCQIRASLSWLLWPLRAGTQILRVHVKSVWPEESRCASCTACGSEPGATDVLPGSRLQAAPGL
jgi:hypothetical protein